MKTAFEIHKPEDFRKPNAAASVILPVRNGDKNPHCQRLLQELKRQTFKDFEVIIVSGASPNGYARNLGVRESNSKILIFIDETSSLGSERVLEYLVNPLLDAKQNLAATGASIRLHPKLSSTQMQYARTRTFEVPKVQHACMAIKKAVFEKVGWESDVLMTGTDDDLRQRLAKENYAIEVIPDTFAYYLAPLSLAEMLRKSFYKGRGSAFAVIHFPGLFEFAQFFGKPIRNRFSALFYKWGATGIKTFHPQYWMQPIRLLCEWVLTLGFTYGIFNGIAQKPYWQRTDLPGYRETMLSPKKL